MSVLGESKNFPGKNCQDIKQKRNTTISKEYWIKPIEGTLSFLVYCEMIILGGGRTLVYNYTFTKYSEFYFTNNAVTPRPNWHAPTANVAISTEPPLSAAFGAVAFDLWQYIGDEVFIR